MPRRRKAVLNCLIRAGSGFVSTDDVAAYVYQHAEDGGPLEARNCVQSQMSHLRKQIRPHGWNIETIRYVGYRLVRADTEAPNA